jgi:membrane protein implicated in regulation of membrane protease activity
MTRLPHQLGDAVCLDPACGEEPGRTGRQVGAAHPGLDSGDLRQTRTPTERFRQWEMPLACGSGRFVGNGQAACRRALFRQRALQGITLMPGEMTLRPNGHGRKESAMDLWLIWLITAALLAAAEIFTLTAALGMLSAAALVTAGFAALGLPLPFQFIVFAVVATVTVLFLRPVALRHVFQLQGAKFGVDALIGKGALVVSEVTGLGGRVRIDGEEWTARSYDETLVIPPGTIVDVLEIHGATAFVYPRG